MNARIWLILILVMSCAAMARAQIYLANPNSGLVSKFDATTGELIHKFAITVSKPKGIAYANGFLYVTDYDTGTVGKYDATTGAVINDRLVTGLMYPLAVAVSGRDLYVSSLTDHGTTLVGKYDAASGDEIARGFATVPALATCLVASPDRLYALTQNAVQVFDAKTGRLVDPYFTHRPWGDDGGMAWQGKDIWLSSNYAGSAGAIGKFDADTGRPTANVTGLFIGRLSNPSYIAVSGDYLYVVFFDRGVVAKYNAYSGSPVNEEFITGLARDISGITVVPTEPTVGPTLDSVRFDLKNFLINCLFYAWLHPMVPALAGLVVGLLLVVVIVAFALRYKSRRDVADAREQGEVAVFFPQGLEKVVLSSFAGAPVSGVWLRTDSEQLAWVHLHRGDVIVAIDGWRIHNLAQFDFLRRRSQRPRLIVWRIDHYMEIAIGAPGRDFPLAAEDYAAV